MKSILEAYEKPILISVAIVIVVMVLQIIFKMDTKSFLKLIIIPFIIVICILSIICAVKCKKEKKY